jgi:hypothetical protein
MNFYWEPFFQATNSQKYGSPRFSENNSDIYVPSKNIHVKPYFKVISRGAYGNHIF